MHRTLGRGALLSRRALLSRSATGGLALIAGGTLAVPAALTTPAAQAASGALGDEDLALARLAVGGELLAIEFYSQAIAAAKLDRDGTKALERARFNEQEHLTAVSQVLTGAGQTPATPDDFTFTFPAQAFASRQAIALLGVELETTQLGIYLGAVTDSSPVANDLKGAYARIAASEAEHLTLFRVGSGGRRLGVSFPPPLDLGAASEALGPYMSTA